MCSNAITAPRPFAYETAEQKYDDAAEQAAVSRIYGGIHIKIDNDDGLILGKRIGGSVAASLARLSPDNYIVKGEVDFCFLPRSLTPTFCC